MEVVQNEEGFFEVQKSKLEEFDEAAKKQKTSLLRHNIALGVLATVVTTGLAVSGMNPFVAFAEAFAVPVGIFALIDIKLLSSLKKQRAEIAAQEQGRGM